jgi:hypothetical protein
MRDGGAVKFDIHNGHWLDVVRVFRRISASLRTQKESAPTMVGRRGNGKD